MVLNVITVPVLPMGLELIELQYVDAIIGGSVLVGEQALRLCPTMQMWLKTWPDPRLNRISLKPTDLPIQSGTHIKEQAPNAVPNSATT